jgi:hypothetical protein
MARMSTDPRTEGDGVTDEERAVLAAALQTLPRRHAPVGVSVHGELAWVCTTPTREKDPGDDWDIYGGWVDIGLVRKRGEWEVWHHSSGGSISWWSPDGSEDGVGVLALVEDAPPPARAAEVRYQGRTYTVPVRHGAFFFAIWDQPPPPAGPMLDDPWPDDGELAKQRRLVDAGESDGFIIERAVSAEALKRFEAQVGAAASDDSKVPVLVRLLP